MNWNGFWKPDSTTAGAWKPLSERARERPQRRREGVQRLRRRVERLNYYSETVQTCSLQNHNTWVQSKHVLNDPGPKRERGSDGLHHRKVWTLILIPLAALHSVRTAVGTDNDTTEHCAGSFNLIDYMLVLSSKVCGKCPILFILW